MPVRPKPGSPARSRSGQRATPDQATRGGEATGHTGLRRNVWLIASQGPHQRDARAGKPTAEHVVGNPAFLGPAGRKPRLTSRAFDRSGGCAALTGSFQNRGARLDDGAAFLQAGFGRTAERGGGIGRVSAARDVHASAAARGLDPSGPRRDASRIARDIHASAAAGRQGDRGITAQPTQVAARPAATGAGGGSASGSYEPGPASPSIPIPVADAHAADGAIDADAQTLVR